MIFSFKPMLSFKVHHRATNKQQGNQSKLFLEHHFCLSSLVDSLALFSFLQRPLPCSSLGLCYVYYCPIWSINNWGHSMQTVNLGAVSSFGHESMALMLVGRPVWGPAHQDQSRAHLSAWLANPRPPGPSAIMHTADTSTYTRIQGPFTLWSVKLTSYFCTFYWRAKARDNDWHVQNLNDNEKPLITVIVPQFAIARSHCKEAEL